MNEDDYKEEVERAKYSDVLAAEFEKCKNIVRALKLKYILKGYDEDDWFQEALVTYWKTDQSYDSSRGCSKGTYFMINFERRIITLLRIQNSSKRKGRFNEISLDEMWQKQGDVGAVESSWWFDSKLDSLELRESLSNLAEYLSKFELAVWLGVLRGEAVEEISQNLFASKSQVVNAVDRIKRKIRGSLK